MVAPTPFKVRIKCCAEEEKKKILNIETQKTFSLLKCEAGGKLVVFKEGI